MKNLTILDILSLFIISYFLPLQFILVLYLGYRLLGKLISTNIGNRLGFSVLCTISTMAVVWLIRLG